MNAHKCFHVQRTMNHRSIDYRCYALNNRTTSKGNLNLPLVHQEQTNSLQFQNFP